MSTENGDVRDHPHFHDKLVEYIELGLSPNEMHRRFVRAFSDVRIPSAQTFNNCLDTKHVWDELVKKFTRERAERLWSLRQSYLRSLNRPNVRYSTLEEKLREVEPEKKSNTHRRWAKT